MSQKNILIDGRAWSRNSAGVSMFLTGAIKAWTCLWDDCTFYVLLPKGIDKTIDIEGLPQNLVLLDYSKYFFRKLPNIIILQILVPYLCRKLNISLYYAPVPHIPFLLPRKVNTMVTIHDVVNIEMPNTMAWTNRMATAFFFGLAVRKADYLWCNSRYTLSKVNQYFPQRKISTTFVGAAVDRGTFYKRNLSDQTKDQVRKRYGIKNRFILFVGSLEPRKNLQFLLQIMPDLYRTHHIQLVVVGGKGWKNSSLSNIVEDTTFPKDSTIFCGYVTSKELSMLYNTADCFVSAALMEGFGMPQVEALLCGCPVVTAQNTAMTEVAEGKDGAITIEGYDPKEWKQSIVKVIEEHTNVNTSQLDDYDWERIIIRLTEFLGPSYSNSLTRG